MSLLRACCTGRLVSLRTSVLGRVLAAQSFPCVDGILSRSFASKKHKNILKQAKGFRGRAKNCFSIAVRRVERAWQFAFRGRKLKHREWRKLWIIRVQAGCRQYGWRYSQFIPALQQCDIVLNRKVLAELASHEPFAFKSVVDVVQHAEILQRREMEQQAA